LSQRINVPLLVKGYVDNRILIKEKTIGVVPVTQKLRDCTSSTLRTSVRLANSSGQQRGPFKPNWVNKKRSPVPKLAKKGAAATQSCLCTESAVESFKSTQREGNSIRGATPKRDFYDGN